MKRYIPKTKGDLRAVEHLQSYSFDAIKPDVPELLRWLQDLNWEVSKGIAEYLVPHVNEIKNELINILILDDDEWKRRILLSLIKKSPKKLNPDLVAILERIAGQPTKGEVEEEVDEQAREIIINNKLK